jgi:hypothetical protein
MGASTHNANIVPACKANSRRQTTKLVRTAGRCTIPTQMTHRLRSRLSVSRHQHTAGVKLHYAAGVTLHYAAGVKLHHAAICSTCACLR